MKVNSNMKFDAVISKYEYGVIYRIRNRDKVEKAMKIQDSIRKRSKTRKSLTKEIRKWRDTRHASRS